MIAKVTAQRYSDPAEAVEWIEFRWTDDRAFVEFVFVRSSAERSQGVTWLEVAGRKPDFDLKGHPLRRFIEQGLGYFDELDAKNKTEQVEVTQ